VVFGRFVSLKKNVFEGQMVATDGGPAPGLPLKGEEKGADGCRRVRYANREWICSKKTKRNKSISDLAGGLVFKVLDILIIEERFFNSSDFGKIVQKLVLFALTRRQRSA
jgi:hypothetical protein